MTAVLQVSDHTITAKEIIPLLTSYQLLPRLLVEMIVDQTITPMACTAEEITDSYQLEKIISVQLDQQMHRRLLNG